MGLENIHRIPYASTPDMCTHVHIQDATDVGENQFVDTTNPPLNTRWEVLRQMYVLYQMEGCGV